jgi:hypothetical protein
MRGRLSADANEPCIDGDNNAMSNVSIWESVEVANQMLELTDKGPQVCFAPRRANVAGAR